MDIKTKFTPDDKCWVMNENRPVEAVVISVKISIEHRSLPARIECMISIGNKRVVTCGEEFIFATKEELKKSIFG